MIVKEFLAWLSFHQVDTQDPYTLRALACKWAPDNDTLFHVCEALLGPDWLSL